MSGFHRKLSMLLLALCAAGAARATVEVRFVQPEKFADVGEGAIEREQNLKQLQGYIADLAGKQVPAAQRLVVDVLDVDLAGEIESRGRRMERLRVLKDVSWPSMKLRYVLSEGDKTLREGEARLSDMGYLMGSAIRAGSEPLGYERRMLEDWFRKEFASAKP